ncbi:hypothetical protein N0Y54_26575 [Nostoc punctiforme UO1]|uniref:hypothetical protein n=1 Tax=Nostoc punctiforme TaxID=272131 RepID=UPI0030A77753
MDTSKKFNQQMEINDLIADAVTNAVTRREILTEEALLGLSDEEAAGIIGGLTSEITVTELKEICPPTVVGLIALPDDQPVVESTTKLPVKGICPPIVVGLIALPDQLA